MTPTTRMPGAPGGGFRVRRVGDPAGREDRGTAGEAEVDEAPPVDVGSVNAEATRATAVHRGGSRTPVGGSGASVASAPKAPAESPDRATSRRRSRSRVLTAALAVILVIAVAAAITFGLEWRAAGSETAAQNAAAASARSLVVALTNFDPGTVGADFSRIKSMSTGAFAGQADRFFATSIGRQLSQAGAASRGKVSALDVQSVNGSQATVFAVVSQTYLNDKQKTPLTDVLRLVIGLTDVNGNWLVSSVQVLQQPVG